MNYLPTSVGPDDWAMAADSVSSVASPVDLDRRRLHWMASVALDAQLPNATAIRLESRVALADAWEITQETCGISASELADVVAARFHLRRADLSVVDPAAASLLPSAIALKFGALPLGRGSRWIALAVSDPTDPQLVQEIGFVAGLKVRLLVAPPKEVRAALEFSYRPDRLISSILQDVEPALEAAVEFTPGAEAESLTFEEVEAEPIVRLTSSILHLAVEQGASDIHIQPGTGVGLVRFRVDGVLRHVMRIPLPVMTRVISRIKVLGRLDITDRLRPQDGRATVRVRGRPFEMRISTVPTRRHEKAVIRVLDTANTPDLENLGIPGPEVARIRQALSFRDGLFVVTGPTGSGKTTTLHAAITEMSPGERNIVSVEDPVERELPDLTQLQVEEAQGLTFPVALRAILRQDPDVIVIGEIRDAETASIAARASLAGHLVLATLHTNDAAGVIGRLEELGIERSVIVDILRGCLAQRLVRIVCSKCAEPAAFPWSATEERMMRTFNVRPRVRATGCVDCLGEGYSGRVPIMELLTPSEALADEVLADSGPRALRRRAEAEGMVSLQAAALARVVAGETTLEEVERVICRNGAMPEDPDEGTAGPTVLVSHRDPVDRAFVRTLLQSFGCRVDEAAGGPAALERIHEHGRYEMIVLDLSMSEVDGRDILRTVRSDAGSQSTHVIALTGDEQPESETQFLRAGADEVFRMPLDPERFLSRIESVLRRRR